jgi:transcriptional regulator with XRE-family HTH domain
MADRQKPLEYAPTGELYRGSQIRALRQAKGWTLTHFGRLLGCQLSALSLIETNQLVPSPGLLARVATLLEVPLAELEAASLPAALATTQTRRRGAARPAAATGTLRGAPAARPTPTPDAPPTTNGADPAAADPWTVADQVAAILASFRLSPHEQQFAQALIPDLVRSVCQRLKEGSVPPPPTTGARHHLARP